jgi:hypothetical protein
MHVRGNLTRVRLTNRGWSPTQEECHADQQWPHRRRAISDASALVIAPRARASLLQRPRSVRSITRLLAPWSMNGQSH